MTNFKDLNIKPTVKHFVGAKISTKDLIDKPVMIHDFKIEDSKCFRGRSGTCLTIQISIDNIKRVVFTSGSELIDVIKKVPEQGFPFTTTIIEVDRVLKFT
jgi:hypothetical protein